MSRQFRLQPHCEAFEGASVCTSILKLACGFDTHCLCLGLSRAWCCPLLSFHSSLIVSRNAHTFYPVWSCAVAIAQFDAAALHRPVLASEVCGGVTQQQDVQMCRCGSGYWPPPRACHIHGCVVHSTSGVRWGWAGSFTTATHMCGQHECSCQQGCRVISSHSAGLELIMQAQALS